MDRDLNQRLFRFAIDVIKFLKTLKYSKETDIIKNQLVRSATSSPANYEEAQAASSRADFKSKVNISLREMRESNFWLRILEDLQVGDSLQINKLKGESEELKRILGSICSKVSQNG